MTTGSIFCLALGLVLNVAPRLDAVEFTGTDLGNPGRAGELQTNAAGGLVVSGSGAGIGLRSDSGYFAWLLQEGDFDFAVRVESLSTPDLFGRAGLMVRTSLSPESPCVGVFTTPSVAGTLFQTRQASGANGRQAGAIPANFPNVWLRLQKAGNLVTGAASSDGRRWVQLDSATLDASAPLYVGLAITSWSTNETASAIFRDWRVATGPIEPAATPTVELPGPTSRRTGLVISEIMFHPAERSDGRDLEFVELFNSQSLFAEIGEFRLSGAVEFTIPAGTVLRPGGFLVVARAPEDVRSISGLTNVIGGYANGLDNASGVVRLLNRTGAVLLEARYESEPPWPAAADGGGHSLVLARPSYGEQSVRAWAASALKGGSPGRWDYPSESALSQVVINEVRARSTQGSLDYIELFNRGAGPADISGAYLSDSPATNRYRFPEGTVVPGGGFHVVDETLLRFGLAWEGETVYFTAGDNTRVVDAVRFGPQVAGLAYGRRPDGASTTRWLEQATPGRANAAPFRSDVVISEIMYHPMTGEDDEYIELFNRGTTSVSLSGWQFTSGIRFVFPSGVVLPAGGYLVVARNAPRLLSRHPELRPALCLGDFSGSLSNQGERVVLSRPETPGASVWIEVAAVEYADGGRWGRWSDGGGSSLELIDPRADPYLASSWADSDETDKGQWTRVEHTGVLDHGNRAYGINQLQVLLEGVGECLLDNIEVIGPGGTNLLANGDFENGATGWFMQGSHRDSTVQAGLGVGGSQGLYVRAESRGDPGANRIRASLPPGLSEGQTVTLRAQARWLRGFPEVLVRLRGNYLEAEGRLKTSPLGTPGRPNSRGVVNAPPAIHGVLHSPVLPAADQPVVVTAQVSDPDGIAEGTLRYRVDPAGETNDVPLRDDGTNGDAVAGDGIFSAMIPGQPANTLVAFHLLARDMRDAAASFPSTAPVQECLVRFGEAQPGGTFGTYRIWMTQAVRNRWATREKLNNAPLDVTFVYGNQRVIYNAGSLYTGSPFVSGSYTSPTSNPLCGYAIHFPGDDVFLGVTDLKLDWPVRDNSLQMEQLAYWIGNQLNLPSNHRRFMFLYVNGVRRGSVYEDSQQPNSEMVAQYFPGDEDGDLYKIDDWFEFDNAASGFNNVDATLANFTTTGGEKKVARYRWNWRKRAVEESASDYRTLFALVDATQANSADDFTRRLEAVVDVEEFLGMIALEHIVGNWDSFGYGRGKNMFAYKPQRGRWQLLAWDIDFVLGSQSEQPEAYLFATIDPTVSQMMFHPPFRRVYLRTLSDAAEGPLQAERYGPVLAGNYAALVANGVSPSFYGGGSNYVARRREYIRQQLEEDRTQFALASAESAITTTEPSVLLQGTAPIEVRRILVNGVAYPVRWSDPITWEMRVPLSSASTRLHIEARNSIGLPVGASRTVTVSYTGVLEDPADRIVLNEIMFRPRIPGGHFVELHNSSAAQPFDLSGWHLPGLNYTFPAGTVLDPGGFAVVARDQTAFWEAYGPEVVPVGVFFRDLDPDGETLRLLAPPPSNRLISEVTYGSQFPWPAAASTGGVSLQLRDPAQDETRVGNWSARTPEIPAEWQQVSITGPASSSRLLLYLSAYPAIRDLASLEGSWDGTVTIGQGTAVFRTEFRKVAEGRWAGDFFYQAGNQEETVPWAVVTLADGVLTFGFTPDAPEFRFPMGNDPFALTGQYRVPGQPVYPATLQRSNPGGDVYVDDLWLNLGMTPGAGPNLLANGDFESPLAGSWTIGANHRETALSSSVRRTGQSSLHLAAATGGYDESTALWQDLPALNRGQTYTLSYWIRRGVSASAVVARLADWSLVAIEDLRPVPEQPVAFTPGQQNSTRAVLPDLPQLWLNECAPVNLLGPTDRLGEKDPWVELFNAGPASVSLAGIMLGDSSTPGIAWSFPPNARIGPAEFQLVWLDASPAQSTDTEWHADFRPAAEHGVLVLWRTLEGGEPQVLDFLEYDQLPVGASVGWPEDGRATARWVFPQPTPLRSNSADPSVAVFINEWMAANNRALVDPFDGDFEDWFELYNAGSRAADLSGYTLSDSAAAPAKFVIPAGTIIPPRGYWIVWADEEPEQNRPGTDLHASFRLSAGGETIRLSAPDGTVLDQVIFGPQPQDLSVGRWPDGSAPPFRQLVAPSPAGPNVWGQELRVVALPLPTGQIEVHWASIAGEEFHLQSTSNLAGDDWRDEAVIVANGPETSVRLENASTGYRFFRVRMAAP